MRALSFAVSLAALPAVAEVPSVVTDILPVHGLVAGVMGDLGTPELIVDASMSAHHATLRPSKARALEEADLIFWIGPELTPWLAEAMEALSTETQDLQLLHVAGTLHLDPRETAVFGDDHDDGHDHGHSHEHDHGHDEDHALDPHAWLDPQNALVWVARIAATLSEADPENAATYAANAAALADRISETEADLAAALAPVRAQQYAVFHDAYQYFEARFELAPVGALLSLDAASASAARVQALTDAARAAGIACLFSEPQFQKTLTGALEADLGVSVATIDPLGADIAPGPDAYPALLRTLGTSIADCLTPSS